jgi:hypothetical protein
MSQPHRHQGSPEPSVLLGAVERVEMAGRVDAAVEAQAEVAA